MSTPLPQVSGGFFSDILVWMRRIIKTSSAQAISDATLADYANRFMNFDLAERLQLLEFRRQYTFETIPNIFEYMVPFTQAQTPVFPANPNPPPFISNPPASARQAQTVVPVYQNFLPPIYCDGVQIGYYQSNDQFYNLFPELVLNEIPLLGNGTPGPFTTNLGRSPVLRGYIDDLGNLMPYVYITTLNEKKQQIYIVDSGYVNDAGEGILIQTDSTFQNIVGTVPTGTPPNAGGAGTINYITGELTFTFNTNVLDQANIEVQTSPYSAGVPRICLFYNNTFKLYPVPDRAYKIQCDAYVTPSVFFSTGAAVPFAYMSEYIARGACQKLLSDTGDWDQYDRYQPLFDAQERLVLRRSDRQRATQRTPTIFGAQTKQNGYLYTQY